MFREDRKTGSRDRSRESGVVSGVGSGVGSRESGSESDRGQGFVGAARGRRSPWIGGGRGPRGTRPDSRLPTIDSRTSLSPALRLLLAAAATITQCANSAELAARHVEHARAQPGIDLLVFLAGGDHRRQRCIVAIIQELKELLARPGGCALGAQVVENQQRRAAISSKRRSYEVPAWGLKAARR